MTREAWQIEVRRKLATPKFVATRANQSNGGQTDAVPIPPSANPEEYLLGVILRMSAKVSNTGATTATFTTANGQTVNDFFLQKLRVLPDVQGNARSKAISRPCIELFEQISLNLRKLNYPPSFPVASIANGATSTITNDQFVPIGGKSAAIEIDIPVVPTTGASKIAPKGVFSVAQLQYDYLAVYGKSPEIVTFDSRVTPSLTTNSDNNLNQWQPSNVSPDFIGFVDKTQITKIIAESDTAVLANLKSSDFTFLQATTPDQAPTYSTTGTKSLWIATNRKRFLNNTTTIAATTATVALTMLAIEWADGESGVSPPAPSPDTPPATPASRNVPGPRSNLTGSVTNPRRVA